VINMVMDMVIIKGKTRISIAMEYTIQHKTISTSTHNIIFVNALHSHLSWYALYTRPKHEKKVYEQLRQRNIEGYLPLYTTIRQWSDRKKKVSEPLFTCYVFVNIYAKDYYTVLNIPGVVRFITFEGKAVTIPENQIRLIRNLLEQDLEILENTKQLQKGTRVEINSGPLIGITGELVEYSNKNRVIIRIDEIRKSILVNVPLHLLTLSV
jgi:transcriptional antiterminator RfaH